MSEKIATREAFGKALVECGRDNQDIVVLDADLSKATMSGTFKREFPDRFFNIGIAEGDMIGTAAGFAATGKIPFACSFAVFAVCRAFEQIRNSVAYPELNVKICGSHSGVQVGEDGATHQAIEDIAVMSAIPKMTVLCPADAVETAAAVKAMAEFYGPVYLRFGRQTQPILFERESYQFVIGKGIRMKSGSDVTLLTTGSLLANTLDAAEKLDREGIHADVIHMPTVKPLDEELLLESAAKTGKVVSIEEGVLSGGLSAAAALVLARKCPVSMRFVGMQNSFGQSGKPEELLCFYHMMPEDIVRAAKDLVGGE